MIILVTCTNVTHYSKRYVAANGMGGGSYEQGGIVVAVLQRSDRLEPQCKLSTLLIT